MKKKRLFDFSIPALLAALIVFPVLVYAFWVMYAYQHRKIFLILLPLLLIGIGVLIYVFGIRAAVIDTEGAHFKKIFIPRDRLEIVSEYDIRFREPVYYLRDRSVDYTAGTFKEQDEKQIRVQATMANTRKLTEYMHAPLIPAKKPKARWKKK